MTAAAEDRVSTGRIYSVTALTQSIRRNLLSNNGKLVDAWIEGEVSGNKIYSSGHRYFALKDANATISCVLFAFNVGNCDAGFLAALKQGETSVNGLKVQAQGELDLNMGRGQYSFKVKRLRIAGLGDKMAAFNALKAKLEAEGLNKLDHPGLRRPLPFLPHRIAIVTSPSGAVIHDLCTVLTRRFPNLEIRLFPVKVQGEGAANEIVGAIDFFNTSAWVPDVLIVGRGGGSVEDLWTFNEEPVVRAVAASRIPVISAVGHESDTTLCDYVADLRAGTPSIAAERAVPVKADLVTRVRELASRLEKAPQQAYESLVQLIDDLSFRLGAHLKEVSAAFERRLQRVELSLNPAMTAAYQRAESRLKTAATSLRHLSPYGVLERGYSITLNAEGRVVRGVEGLVPGARLTTRLANSAVTSVVETFRREGERPREPQWEGERPREPQRGDAA